MQGCERCVTKNKPWEREIFALFYHLWCKHWKVTFIIHDEFSQRYAVFSWGEKEEILFGVSGM